MEYQWKYVEVFLKRLGFLAEARRLVAENTDLSRDKLVEAISETLEPHNLRNLVGNDNLVSIQKGAKSERNHRLILARYGIGCSGSNSFEKLGEKFGISNNRPLQIIQRFESFAFPMERVLYFLSFMDVADSKEIFYRQLKDARTMTRKYVNPIKLDIYYRCLEKVLRFG